MFHVAIDVCYLLHHVACCLKVQQAHKTCWVLFIMHLMNCNSVGYFHFKLYLTIVFVPTFCSYIAIDTGRAKTDVFDIV